MAPKNAHNVPLLFLFTLAILQGILAVDFTAINLALNTAGGAVFENQIGVPYAEVTIAEKTNIILNAFASASLQATGQIQSAVQVDLVIVPSLPSNVAAKTINNQIQVSAEYLAGFIGDVKTEFTGIIIHELTHILQWKGAGQAPGGLLEGIADYMRLKAGYIARGWAQPGDGTRWDEGYSTTARFLDYCVGLKGDFVAQLNMKMKDGYSDGFFEDLLGKSVNQLWSDYKAKYGH